MMDTKDKIFAIYDEDIRYAKRFTDYLQKKHTGDFIYIAFSKMDSLRKYINNHRLEVLLADESILDAGREKAGLGEDAAILPWLQDMVGFCFLLTDELRPNPQSEISAIPCINRYQSCDQIFNHIVNICCPVNELVVKEAAVPKGQKLIGVYSPAARCGKTGFSLVLANVLGRRYQSLYMSLEQYSLLLSLLDFRECRDISDLLYLLRQGEDNLSKEQLAIKQWGDTEVIVPMINPDDLFEISSEEVLNLTTALGRYGYQRIILDIGIHLAQHSSLLGACDQIYMPLLNSQYCEIKKNLFYTYLDMTDKQEIKDKINPLYLPDTQWGEDDGFSPEMLLRSEWKTLAEKAVKMDGLM